jgi:hypothetical protein
MATSSGGSGRAFPSSAHAAFKRAMQGFKNGLGNEKLYSEILATTSVGQVYDLTDKFGLRIAIWAQRRMSSISEGS